MARALMLQGTGSDVGKTVLVAGLCRAARRRGLRVVPFKPQNMSNNAAAVSADENGPGGEIGRAQWLQALAAGVAPSVHMNPVLLKPQSDTGSQVVVHGQVMATAAARDYQRLRPRLLAPVMQSFRHLADRADLVLVEGAGSAAEVNLRRGDIANMGFAVEAAVPVVLVGDIDRGGVIAALVGTHTIMAPGDRGMVRGYIINKFRGDVGLFEDGLATIHRHTGWRSFGVVPWLEAAARLPAEDSVALERLAGQTGEGGVKVAVPVTPRIANFDDFDALAMESDVELVFVRAGESLPADADLVVLAGSKSTIADLAALRENGWADEIARHAARGGRVIGICGGYQMLGTAIHDPDGVEGAPGSAAGLGLLAVETVLAPAKVVRNGQARLADGDLPLAGYEIHAGRTTGADCARPMIAIEGAPDGAVSRDGRIQGCYLHGLFAGDAYRAALIRSLGGQPGGDAFAGTVEAALDGIATALEDHLDVDALLASAAPVATGAGAAMV